MAFSVASLFSPRPQQQQAQAAPPPPATPGSSMQQQNQGAGAGTGEAGTTPAASPMDAYKDLWKKNDSKGQQAADPFSQPLFTTDSGKLREAVTKTDFMQGVPAELMQKVMSGGDPQSLIQLINHVGQQSLGLALQLQTATQEQAWGTVGKRFNESLPNKFQEFQLKSQTPTNPILQNPAIEPMLQMTRSQMRMMHPDKPVSEINKLAEQYLTDFASTLAGGNGPSSGDAGEQKKDTDWAQWGGLG